VTRRAIRAVLGAAVSLRVFAAFSSLGFDHPNEPFRLLEPIASMRGFSAVLPWEWTQGLLSELPARAHLPAVALAAGLGLGPIGQIIALKLLYAMASLSLVYASWGLARGVSAEEDRDRAGDLALVASALWPELIYHSARLMDYSLEAVLLSLACVDLLLRGRSARAGAWLGAAFFIRFQSGLHYLSLSLAMIFCLRRPWRDWVRLSLGYGGVMLLGAVSEKLLSARPDASLLGPFVNYIRYNAIEGGAARDYGADPWHRYLTEWAKYWGWFGGAAVIGVIGMASRQTLRPISRRMSALAVVALLPLMTHALIAHKEGRFIFGFIWLAIPLAAVAAARIRQRGALALAAILALAGAGVAAARVAHRWDLRARDVRTLAKIGSQIPTAAPAIRVLSHPAEDPLGFFLQTRSRFCRPSSSDPCARMPELHIGTEGWELR